MELFDSRLIPTTPRRGAPIWSRQIRDPVHTNHDSTLGAGRRCAAAFDLAYRLNSFRRGLVESSSFTRGRDQRGLHVNPF
jgi:hypothetical protein